jgi:hypothetical protein
MKFLTHTSYIVVVLGLILTQSLMLDAMKRTHSDDNEMRQRAKKQCIRIVAEPIEQKITQEKTKPATTTSSSEALYINNTVMPLDVRENIVKIMLIQLIPNSDFKYLDKADRKKLYVRISEIIQSDVIHRLTATRIALDLLSPIIKPELKRINDVQSIELATRKAHTQEIERCKKNVTELILELDGTLNFDKSITEKCKELISRNPQIVRIGSSAALLIITGICTQMI